MRGWGCGVGRGETLGGENDKLLCTIFLEGVLVRDTVARAEMNSGTNHSSRGRRVK